MAPRALVVLPRVLARAEVFQFLGSDFRANNSRADNDPFLYEELNFIILLSKGYLETLKAVDLILDQRVRPFPFCLK